MSDEKSTEVEEVHEDIEPETDTDAAEVEVVPEPGEEGKKRRKKRIAVTACAVALAALLGTGVYLGVSHRNTPTDMGASQTEQAAGASSTSGDVSKTDDGEKAHTHDWSITYKTVHHDAVTHTEHVAPVFQNQTTYHTVCNECKQVIDGKADEHIKETGHSGYSTNVPITDEVMVSEGYDKVITDTPAYDETVIDKLVCTTCGATKDAPQATTDAAK